MADEESAVRSHSAAMAATDDHGDTPNSATLLREGERVLGVISSLSDVDFFGGRFQQGLTYLIDVTYLGGDDTPLGFSTDGGAWYNYFTNSSQYALTPAVTGDSYFAISTLMNGSANYAISCTVAEDDIGHTAATSAALTVGGSASGTTNYRVDKDWFRIDLAAATAYKFSVSSTSGGAAPSLKIVSLNQGTPSYSTPGDIFTVATAGTYYVEVSGGALGQYTVSAARTTDDFGSSLSTAGTLVPGTPIAGRFEFAEDRDTFRMAVEDGHFYVIDFSSSQSAGSLVMPLENVAFINGLNHSSGGASTTTTFKAVGSGEVALYLSGHSIGSYSVTARDLGLDDHGESRETATVMNIGTTSSGNLAAETDRDVFRVQLEGGVSYVFEASGTARPLLHAAGAFNLDLKGAKSWFTPASSGEYLVNLASRGSDSGVTTGAYTVTAALAADDFAANPAGAGRMTANRAVTGNLNSGEDRDWFAIDLVAGVTYWFDGNFVAGAAPMMRIADAAGVTLAHAPEFNTVSQFSYMPSSSGTYYLEAGHRTGAQGPLGSYGMSAIVGKADDHVLPEALALGATVTGKTEIVGDTDTFRIDLAAGNYYRVVREITKTNGVSLSGLAQSFAVAGQLSSTIHLTNGWIQPKVSGTYDAVFAGTSLGAGTTYSVRFELIGPDDQAVGAAPLVVMPGTQSAGIIEVPGDRDTFAVALAAGQKVKVSVLGSASGAGTLDLQSGKHTLTMSAATAAGSSLNAAWTGTGAGGQSTVFVVPEAGTYLLAVASSVAIGSYQVAVENIVADSVAPVFVSASSRIAFVQDLQLVFSENVLPAPLSYASLLTAQGAEVGLISIPSEGALAGTTIRLDPSTNLMPGASYQLLLRSGMLFDQGYNANAQLRVNFTVAASTVASAGQDVFAGKVSGARIDGGAGRDTVVFGGVLSDYTIRVGSPDVTVSRSTSTATPDILYNIERLMFSRGDAYALDTKGAGIAGMAYRLYQAAFDRAPDKGGVGFWIDAMDGGMSLRTVAHNFVASAEFTALYGANPSNADFVARLYQNILNRPGEQGGVDFWLGALAAGSTRADVLASFSESAENIDALAQVIGNGFQFTPYG